MPITSIGQLSTYQVSDVYHLWYLGRPRTHCLWSTSPRAPSPGSCQRSIPELPSRGVASARRYLLPVSDWRVSSPGWLTASSRHDQNGMKRGRHPHPGRPGPLLCSHQHSVRKKAAELQRPMLVATDCLWSYTSRPSRSSMSKAIRVVFGRMSSEDS